MAPTCTCSQQHDNSHWDSCKLAGGACRSFVHAYWATLNYCLISWSSPLHGMLHDLWTTYSTLSQLTPREQCQTHCSNSNPNPYPLPNHYLAYIIRPQILQQVLCIAPFVGGAGARDYSKQHTAKPQKINYSEALKLATKTLAATA